MAQVQHFSIPLTTDRQRVQVNWKPRGLILSNASDAIVTVESARGSDTWRCPPGRTVKRPLFYGQDAFNVYSETVANSGEALLVLTDEPVLELAGETAETGDLFRRVAAEDHIVQTVGLDTTIKSAVIGPARYAQIILDVVVRSPEGYVQVEIGEFDTSGGGGAPQLVNLYIPQGGTFPTLKTWRFGPGGDLALPRTLGLTLISFVGFTGTLLNTIRYQMEVWQS